MVALCLLVMEAEATAAVWGPGTTSLGTGSPQKWGMHPKEQEPAGTKTR